ncbi:MAG TPA: hypothetical protein VLT47_06345 [Anaeromyxobacteraceae bacterium]|nr:hypothetical protein [Anaeromyxobacteraceae bacterium]
MVACLLALAACEGGAGDAARAVREYDDALIRAFRLTDPSKMTQVAAREEADRVRVLVDLKAASRLVLESTLERFEVRSSAVAPGGGRATVETAERWRYFDRALSPGQSPGPVILSEMRMRYDLVREAGRWKVAEVTTLANQVERPSSGSPSP